MTSRFSRGGAQGLLGIRPDLTTLGKYLAGGFTFGAFGGRAEVMAHFDPAAGGVLGHAGTFNNNVVSMAAGVATLTEMLTDDVLDATHARGERLRAALNDTFDRNGLTMCATGVGSLMNVHGTSGPVRSVDDLADADDRLKELLFFHCLDDGFYMARRGFIALSIEITDADVAAFVDVVDGFRPDRGQHQAGLKLPGGCGHALRPGEDLGPVVEVARRVSLSLHVAHAEFGECGVQEVPAVAGAVHPRGHHGIGGAIARSHVLAPCTELIAGARDPIARVRAVGSDVEDRAGCRLCRTVAVRRSVQRRVEPHRSESAGRPLAVDQRQDLERLGRVPAEGLDRRSASRC